jgi:aminopeptidase N
MIPEDGTIARVAALQGHPAFAITNPNRVRALLGTFAMANPTQFARPDGAGFRLMADAIRTIDGTNPQLAARLLTAFGSWKMLESGRRTQATVTLGEFASAGGLSRDVADILGRTLENG